MTVFKATVQVKGENGKIVPRYFDLGNFATGTPEGDYAAAVIAINQVVGALDAITDGAISEVTLTGVVSTSAAAGAGNVFEAAQLSLYLDAAGEKVVTVYVPAPSIGIFTGASGPARDIVDTADADLIQYVQQLSQHTFLSDGEQVNVTVNNGIKVGVRDIRDMNLKK